MQFQELGIKKPRKTTNPTSKPITIKIANAKIKVPNGANPILCDSERMKEIRCI